MRTLSSPETAAHVFPFFVILRINIVYNRSFAITSIDIPLNVAIERLAQRHMNAWGFSHKQAMQRINQSDGLNAELVARYRNQADWLIKV